jgi:hypothetical protein
MDADGDGTVSLQEFKAAHERLFKAMDADKDGRLTMEGAGAPLQRRVGSITMRVWLLAVRAALPRPRGQRADPMGYP